jgi:hypothetical protein
MDAKSIASRFVRRLRSPFVVIFALLLGVIAPVWISLREYRSSVIMAVQYEDDLPSTTFSRKQIIAMEIAGEESLLRDEDEVIRPVIERLDLSRAFSPNGSPLSFLETKDRLAQSNRGSGRA